ncbi:MAG: hypothetical protein AB1757_00625 [Acidobacteriota bacterium]
MKKLLKSYTGVVLSLALFCGLVLAQSGRNNSRTRIAPNRSRDPEPPVNTEKPLPPPTPPPVTRPTTGDARGLIDMVKKNTWQGLTPLRSTTADVARMFGEPADAPDSSLVGPYKTETGVVTFSYLTASLAKLYRAPAAMANKVFTIYLKPATTIFRGDLKIDRSFKKCAEQDSGGYYYLVNDAGVAYHIKASTEQIETIIFQPSRLEVRRLAVNTECVF